MRFSKFILALSFLCLFVVQGVFAATIEVNTTLDGINKDGLCSLREAVYAANDNLSIDGCTAGEAEPVVDVINVPEGVYELSVICETEEEEEEPIEEFSTTDFSAAYCGDLKLFEDVLIKGAGKGVTVIDSVGSHAVPVATDASEGYVNDHYRIFSIHPYVISGSVVDCSGSCNAGTAVTIEDLTLQGGSESLGGAIYAEVVGCEIPNLTLNRVELKDNYAEYAGGAVYIRGQLITNESDFIDNTAGYQPDSIPVGLYSGTGLGGGVYFGHNYFSPVCEFNSTISASAFQDNTAYRSGGGIHIDFFNNILVRDSNFESNAAGTLGAGIASFASNLTVQNTQITGGHGIAVTPTPIFLEASAEDEAPTYIGGGIYYSSNLLGLGVFAAEDSEVSYEPSDLLVQNSNISDNSALFSGGGIQNGGFYAYGSGSVQALAAPTSSPTGSPSASPSSTPLPFDFGSAVIMDTIVSGNQAFVGGGISSDILSANMQVLRTTVDGNAAYVGAGIANQWVLEVSASTISNNTVIEEEVAQEEEILTGFNVGVQELVDHLYVYDRPGGGGLANRGSSVVVNSTITGNESYYSGGGVLNEQNRFYLKYYLISAGGLSADVLGADAVVPSEGEILPAPGTQLRNVTLVANKVIGGGEGFFPAGVAAQADTSEETFATVFVSNGGGVASLSGSITLRNTIVATNEDLSENIQDEFDSRSFGDPGDPDSILSKANDCWLSQYSEDRCFSDNSLLAENSLSAKISEEEFCEMFVPRIVSERYNLLGDNTGCSADMPVSNSNNDQVGTEENPIDPLLGALADNSGSTLTHLPQQGSPVIDAANPSNPVASLSASADGDENFACEPSDQRNIARPQDGNNDSLSVCDIGAVEVIVDCAGDPNGDAEFDECGVCGGDNSSCLDCAGVPNGKAVKDDCGVCNGDGSSCVPVCEDVNISSDQFILDGSGLDLKALTKRLRRALRKLTGSQTAGNTEVQESEAQYQTIWSSTWSIESVQKVNCTNTSTCITVSNASGLAAITSSLETLHALNKKLIQKIRKAGAKRKKVRRFNRRNDGFLESALNSVNAIPASSVQCGVTA